MDIINFLISYAKLAQITDLIDIVIVSTFIYFLLKKIKGSSAERLLKGVSLVLIATLLSSMLKLNTIYYILENLMQVGLISLVIVFQPELRKGLEKMGKTKLYKHGSSQGEELSEGEIIINEIVDSCRRLSDAREGALIVFERDDSIKEIIESGVKIDAKITSEIVRNIFYPKAPLHDGAVVIKDGKIAAASCILPLSNNQSISKDLGTRHRAAVGMTEYTDTICVVVSEETGAISVSTKGMLKRHLSSEILSKLLNYELISKDQKNKKQGILVDISEYFDKLINKYFGSIKKNKDK